MSTVASVTSPQVLRTALDSFLKAARSTDSTPPPSWLYRLVYEQSIYAPKWAVSGRTLTLAPPKTAVAFEDDGLDNVLEAWKWVMGDEADEQSYLVFEAREGEDIDDDGYAFNGADYRDG